MMQDGDRVVQFIAMLQKGREPGGGAVAFLCGVACAHAADIQERASDPGKKKRGGQADGENDPDHVSSTPVAMTRSSSCCTRACVVRFTLMSSVPMVSFSPGLGG